jgi:ubiquinone/menaquinone biosynthesis C-methylase UbiE
MVVPSRLSNEPENAERFTREWDRVYTAFAQPYDVAVRLLPVWKTWLRRAVPHIVGPRVLEVSFGTGYLISEYAGNFETHGIDYNRRMVTIARKNLSRVQREADLVRGNVEALPYADASFDSLVNTMAFSGYPNGAQALVEMRRVLRNDGRLILIERLRLRIRGRVDRSVGQRPPVRGNKGRIGPFWAQPPNGHGVQRPAAGTSRKGAE